MRLPIVLVLTALASGSALAQTGGNPSFTLANRGNQVINEVYATATGVDRWGPDRLARFNLPPGMTYPVRLPADGSCVFDLRVVYANGQPEERRRVNTCTIDSVAFPGGRTAGAGDGGRSQAPTNDPSFRLVNRGRVEVNSIYATPAGVDDWGEDRLGDETVGPGQTHVIRLPPGQCTYDVRVVFANNEATEKRRLNLCTITDLRVP